MTMPRYLTNKIMTPSGHILQSFYRHDYKTFFDPISNEEYLVDGGVDYLRRNVNNIPATELSLEFPQPHSVVRQHLTWGTYGKDGKLPFTRVALVDMETDHIKAVLDTQPISDHLRASLVTEIEYRNS